MTATTPFDVLATELFDIIIEDLDFPDLVALWKSSPRLSYRLEHTLFGPKPLQRTLRWACKTGDVAVIRAAIANGADPSFITNKPYTTVSTLCVAARRYRAEAFRTLLELGATLAGAMESELKRLTMSVLRERRWDILEHLKKAGQISFLVHETSAWGSLSAHIANDIPAELLEAMFEEKPSLNPSIVLQAMTGPRNGWYVTPLSAAIKKRSKATVEVLLEKGADIHGAVQVADSGDTSQLYTYIRPSHIPLFAAAIHMARTGSPEMVELCLRNGANINQRAPALLKSCTFGHHFTTTPLMTYLEKRFSLDVPEDALKPKMGVDYFLTRGAILDLVPSTQSEEWPWIKTERLDFVNWYGFEKLCQPLSAVEVLLGKWGLSVLHKPSFRDTVAFLIELGSGSSRAETIIHTFSCDSQRTNDPLPQVHPNHSNNVEEWWEILSLIWDGLDRIHRTPFAWLRHSFKLHDVIKDLIDGGVNDQNSRDLLLYQFLRRGLLVHWPEHYGILERLAIDRLQECGADINGRVGDNDKPILHELCHHLNRAYVKGETDVINPDCGYELYQVKYLELLVSLVDKGANPEVLVEGLSAYDILEIEISEASQDSQAYLGKLVVEVLRDTRKKFLREGSTPSAKMRRADLSELKGPAKRYHFEIDERAAFPRTYMKDWNDWGEFFGLTS